MAMRERIPSGEHDHGHDSMDDVIALYKRDIDMTLIRERLAMSVEQRFATYLDALRLVEELQRAGAAAGRPRDLEAIAELESLRRPLA